MFQVHSEKVYLGQISKLGREDKEMHKSITNLLHNIKTQELSYLRNHSPGIICVSQQHTQSHRVVREGILKEKPLSRTKRLKDNLVQSS